MARETFTVHETSLPVKPMNAMPTARAATAAVVASTVGNFVSATPMVNSVFGLFLIPLASEFNWPRADVSAVLGIVAVCGALCYPLAGRLADRYGTRPIILLGNLLFALSIAALSLIDGNLLQFYLLFVLLGVAASMPSTVLYTKVISGWFHQRRGFFLGLTAGVGNGAGATLMPIVCGVLIAAFGWRAAYQGLGLITLLGFPVLFLLLRDSPRAAHGDAGDHPHAAGLTLAQARRTPVFWMIVTAIALGGGCMTAVFTHVIPMLQDRGASLQRATTVLSVFAFVSVAWQITVGAVFDRVHSPRVAAPFYLAALAGLLLFQYSDSFALQLSAAALMGIGLGTEYGVLPYYVSRYFGLRAYGAISGMVYGTDILVMGFTPYFMDKAFDVTGSYDSTIYVICGALALGAAMILRLPPYDAALTAAPALQPQMAYSQE